MFKHINFTFGWYCDSVTVRFARRDTKYCVSNRNDEGFEVNAAMPFRDAKYCVSTKNIKR
jgi:hypothetical protein